MKKQLRFGFERKSPSEDPLFMVSGERSKPELKKTGAQEVSERKFWLLSAFVLIISVLLAPFLGHHYDPNLIAYAGVELANGTNPYGLSWWYGYAYPPLYLYYSSFIGILLNDVPLNPIPPYRIPPLHLFLIKLPAIVSHLGVAATLFYSGSPRFPRYVSYLYLLSPFTLFMSAVWGAIDELCALFILLTVILLYRGRWGTAGLMWGIVSAIKIYPFLPAAVPILFIINRRQKAPLNRFLSFTLSSFGLFFIVSLPFLISDWYTFTYRLIWRVGFAGWIYDIGLSYGTALWALIGLGGSAFSFIVIIPVSVFIILFSYLIIRLAKPSNSLSEFDELAKPILALVLMAFLATIVINEMDYIWVFPLLLLYWERRHKVVGKKFMVLNIILILGTLIDWTPLDFIPSIDPSIIVAYQTQTGIIFRLVVVAAIGIYVSIKVVLHEIRRIFNELKVKAQKAESHIREATQIESPIINSSLRYKHTPRVVPVD